VSRSLVSDVDVVVDGQRILAVSDSGGWDGDVVDARDSVVIPGLVDMHNHREMQGYGYGDRQGRLWLSLGITPPGPRAARPTTSWSPANRRWAGHDAPARAANDWCRPIRRCDPRCWPWSNSKEYVVMTSHP
jgi:hypothetical protein